MISSYVSPFLPMLLRRSRVLSSANVVLVLKEPALDAVLEGFDVHGVFDANSRSKASCADAHLQPFATLRAKASHC